jgi:hypothetical protein
MTVSGSYDDEEELGGEREKKKSCKFTPSQCTRSKKLCETKKNESCINDEVCLISQLLYEWADR